MISIYLNPREFQNLFDNNVFLSKLIKELLVILLLYRKYYFCDFIPTIYRLNLYMTCHFFYSSYFTSWLDPFLNPNFHPQLNNSPPTPPSYKTAPQLPPTLGSQAI